MNTRANFLSKGHNPDVLSCIANLSSDEIFTPPELANSMLDVLEASWSASNSGEDIWSRKDIRFLDPCTKSGVFLREIVVRLNEGLAEQIPEINARIDHILTNQIFGIGITQLTSLLSRRTVYCSKFANSDHSVATSLQTPEGNIWFQRNEHSWLNEHCRFCGAKKSEYQRGSDLESHAYALTHMEEPKKSVSNIFGDGMHFDVVIGNPPYQLSIGNTGTTKATARAIYHDFVDQALTLDPRFLMMVIPSRWMTRSTKGVPDEWIDKMIDDPRIRVLHDYTDSTAVFPNVEIKGGVCYFLWDRDNKGVCDYVLHRGSERDDSFHNVDFLNSKGIGVVIRDVDALSIIHKIELVEGNYLADSEQNFSGLVSPKDFFTNKEMLTSSWSGFALKKDDQHTIKYYLNKNMHRVPFGYVKLSDIPKNKTVEALHKVFIPASGWGSAMESDDPVLGTPFVGEPHSVCSQTYLVIGHDQSKGKLSSKECYNIVSYIKTKFFRYLVSLKKHTQHAARGVYQFVPLQDFSEPWDDDKLFEKYGFTTSEISAIEHKIRSME